MKNTKPGHIVPCVCIDAGHFGKYNRSPVVPEYYESDMNWKLHLLLKAELEKLGISVITTRAEQEKDLALDLRGKASKDSDLFLSLHSNASDSESTDYVVAFYQVDDDCGEMDKQSLEISARLSNCVAEVMGCDDARYWAVKSSHDRDGNGYKDDYYGVLRGAHTVHTPGVILEHGFHTNKAQTEWLLDENNLKKLAKAEAKVIADWFEYRKEDGKPTEETKTLPAFSVLEWQKAAIADGFKFPKYGADGKWGAECESVARNAVCKQRVTYKYKNLTRLVQRAVGVSVDGLFGSKTKAAVKAYQSRNGLDDDGAVGINTWKKILGV